MSLVAEAPVETPVPSRTPPGYRRILWSLLPWLLPVVAMVWVLRHNATPDSEIALYGAYFTFAVMLPGTLVFRALFGSRGNWPEDLGLGAATGLVVMLCGWALGAATGMQHLLPGWPALVVVLFLAVPRLRRHWRAGPGEPLPLAWSWAMAVVLSMLALWAAVIFRTIPLPPATFELYPDLYYHLALVHEMTRTMPFQVPQLAGETLRYHYLSDADIATASMITGIAPTTVFFRLWLLPIAGVAVVVYAALARSVSGKWWAGPVAATVGFIGQAVSVGGSAGAPGIGLPITLVSPSQTFAMPLIGLFVVVAVDALRGRRLHWWGWAALPLLAVACAGSKASVLPPLAAGLLLAAVVMALIQRRAPWTTLGLLAVVGFGMAVGLRLFAGGGAGTLQLQFLSTLRWFLPYQEAIGIPDDIEWGGLTPNGLEAAGTGARWFVAWTIVWWLLVQSPRLAGLFLTPRLRGDRRADPVPWLLGGIVIAGVLGMWLLWHPSASQIYFFNAVQPVCGVLTAWALADRVRNWAVPVLGAVAGGLWEFFAPEVSRPAGTSTGEWAWALAVPLLRTLALVAVISLIVVLIWRRRGARTLSTALAAAVIAAVAASGTVSAVTHTVEKLRQPPDVKARQGITVTRQEMQAALWLEEHAGDHDLVATNVHCMPMRTKLCNARAFWVAGLGGHRALVESWGYTDDTVAANGKNGLKYFFQPAPDLAVFELNQRVFTDGDPADVARLRDEFGVRWLLADTRAGSVSRRLTTVAPVRYRKGPVAIHELR